MMWVHDMIHRTQIYSEYHHLGLMKEPLCLSEKLRDFQNEALSSHLLPQMYAPHQEQLKKDGNAR